MSYCRNATPALPWETHATRDFATRDSCNNGVQFDANAEFRNQIFSRNDMPNLVKWICHYSLTHWGTMVIYAVPWQTHATVEWHSGTSLFGLYSNKFSFNDLYINLQKNIISDISSLILKHTSRILTVVLEFAIEGAMWQIGEMAHELCHDRPMPLQTQIK